MKWYEVKKLARELRKNQTSEEALLWTNLRNRKCSGIKFYRQHPIRYEQHNRQHFFIADFYSKEISIVVELDGKVHDYQFEYDKQRVHIIRDLGINVIRFSNDQINHAMIDVIKKIKEFV